MGLIGFAAYVSIYIYAFKGLNKLNSNPEDKVFKIGLISTLVAYMFHNFFIFDTSANYVMFFLVLGFINLLTVANNQLSAVDSITVKPKNILANFAGIVLMIAVILSIYFFEVRPAKANYATTRAIVASWNSDHDFAFEKFKEAMDYNTFGKYEIRHRYGQYILERTSGLSKIDEKNQEKLLTAIENIKKNTKESKQDYLPYLYLSRLYIVLGKSDPGSFYNDMALEHSLKALEISPTFVRTYYEIAQAYLNKKDYQKAIEWFEKVKVLNPEVKLSHWYLGITYAQKGDLNKAAQVIESSGYPYKDSETDSLRMIEIYFRLGDYRKLSEIYEALIKLNSKDPQYYASLAAAYKQIGEIDKAIKAAQTAAQIDPTFAKEAQDFINSLR